MKRLFVAAPLLVLLIATGCTSPKGASTQERRDFILYMRDDTLNDLYQRSPTAEAEVEDAPGYAVFTNVGVSLMLLGGGQGYGVVVDNETDEATFMRMAQGSVGFGLGAKDFRAVFVFQDRDVLDRFTEGQWQFGGEADAAATSKEKGGQVGGAATATGGIKIYQFTRAGIKLRASLPLTKYWRYNDLN